LLLATCGGRPAPAQRVVLITCDTLRADRLGAYGCERPTSPALDAFAREGLVFDEAYSSAPLTGPALASLLTGRMPDEIGVAAGNGRPLSGEAVTLQELVLAAGIPTGAIVSNWILRRPGAPHEDGGVAQGFATFDDRMGANEAVRGTKERLAPETTEAALAWLAERRSAGEERFFLWVHYQDPHGPYVPPDELARLFPPTASEPALPLGKDEKGLGQIPRYQALGDERDPAVYRARYDAEVRCFDLGFGRLVERLREYGWLDGSLVVFTADHGEALGDHDHWFCHGENVYRELTRVPLIVRYPRAGLGPPGRESGGFRRVPELVGHVDLWRTMLTALGLEAGPQRGLSLLEASLPAERVVLHTLGRREGKRWLGIRGEDYHVVVPPRSPPRLFDVRTDPGELHDLAAERPETVAELLRRGREFLALDTRPPLVEGRAKRAPELEAALRDLGYAGDDEDE